MDSIDLLECMPVHAVFLAIGEKLIRLRRHDRQLHPERDWAEIVTAFGRAYEAAREGQAGPRRAFDDTMRAQLSARQSMAEAERLLLSLPWTGDPDPDIAALAEFTGRYMARVPEEIVAAHAKAHRHGETVALNTEQDVRTYLMDQFAYLAEDTGGRFTEDRPR